MTDAARPWWQTEVVYQIYPRSFQDTDADGVGDLPGVTERLGYVAELGVGAVWLSPFYPSPQADFGYDVADYCDVDPQFGTLADFDRLVERAHELGLRVIVDVVPNHSSEQHPWFQESRASRESPRRDWYIWRDPAPGGGPPNNWLSIFGGPAWTFDEATGQYYLHTFLSEQPDLNWRNPDVVNAMMDVLRFWMARGVDGFRVDAVLFSAKHPDLPDLPPRRTAAVMHKPTGEYDTLEHVYDAADPVIHEYFRRYRETVDGFDGGPGGEPRERVLIGELHAFQDLDRWASYYGRPGPGGTLDELHLPYNFGLLNVAWTAAALREHVDAVEAAVPPGAWPNYVLGNHDERRIASRLGPGSVRLAMLLLLTLRGAPTLYYGDELGLPEADVPDDRRVDPWGFRSGLPELSRDGCRTPMVWDRSPAAGFSDADPQALWLPLHRGHADLSVEAQAGDPDSHLAFARRALAFRGGSDALRAGDYRALLPAEGDGVTDDVFAFERTAGGNRALVLLHVGDGTARVELPDGYAGARLALSTHDREAEGAPVGAAVELGPFAGVVLTPVG